MELFLVIAEAVLWIADLVISATDLYSWFRGRPNRIERKEARAAGELVPPRDQWNRRVLVLSLIVLILTTGLLVWRTTKLR